MVSSAERDAQAWSDAVKFVKSIGNISPAFSSCIRTIRVHQEQDGKSPPQKLDKASEFLVERFLKSATVKAPFYFLAKTFRPKQLEQLPSNSTKDLVSLFSPRDITSILALIYLYKRARAAAPAEDWEKLSKLIHEQTDIGGYFGEAFPSIGFADGLLIGGIRHISTAMFLIKDKKGFGEHRRELKIKGLNFNIESEMNRWGCTHLHLLSMLLLSMGFGKAFTFSLHSAMSNLPDTKLSSDSLRLRLAARWIDSLHSGKEPAKITGEEDYLCSEDALNAMHDKTDDIRSKGSAFAWLSRGKKDAADLGDQADEAKTEDTSAVEELEGQPEQ